MATRSCDVCGSQYRTPRPDSSKYCSPRCKNRGLRGAKPRSAAVVDLPVTSMPASSVVAATRAELAAVGRLDTYLGQAALAAAERVDGSRAVQGYAALLKEYRDTMREAVRDVEQHADAADQIREAALRLIEGTG